MKRRSLLAAACGFCAGGFFPLVSARPLVPPAWGGSIASPFEPSVVLNAARERAAGDFTPRGAPDVMADVSYDVHRAIRFDTKHTLWRDKDIPFQVQFFHPGRYFAKQVAIREVASGGAREIPFARDVFSFDQLADDYRMRIEAAEDVGYAGFRLLFPLNRPDVLDEVAAFLGASYFRGVGTGNRFGLSARGVAVDTAGDREEEFPAFVEYWLEQPACGAESCRFHALLDGPSLAGAYSITLTPGDPTVMDVEATLIPRREIQAIGIAPLTSMYLFGPMDPPRFHDFRPRVHDSQGLAVHMGNGERLWRPLANPKKIEVSAYKADRVLGFGLSQRQRAFRDYQDLNASYHLRPSAWVEPADDWGAGSVQLIELPAADETVDNIVAFWRPEVPLAAGEETTWRYRLSWGNEVEPAGAGARAMSSRTGVGGVPGTVEHGEGVKFVVDFSAADNDNVLDEGAVGANVSATGGEVRNPVAHRNTETGGWRLFFDVIPHNTSPVELRCFLSYDKGALSETWSYRWYP